MQGKPPLEGSLPTGKDPERALRCSSYQTSEPLMTWMAGQRQAESMKLEERRGVGVDRLPQTLQGRSHRS